jgi:hypothetical protein
MAKHDIPSQLAEPTPNTPSVHLNSSGMFTLNAGQTAPHTTATRSRPNEDASNPAYIRDPQADTLFIYSDSGGTFVINGEPYTWVSDEQILRESVTNASRIRSGSKWPGGRDVLRLDVGDGRRRSERRMEKNMGEREVAAANRAVALDDGSRRRYVPIAPRMSAGALPGRAVDRGQGEGRAMSLAGTNVTRASGMSRAVYPGAYASGAFGAHRRIPTSTNVATASGAARGAHPSAYGIRQVPGSNSHMRNPTGTNFARAPGIPRGVRPGTYRRRESRTQLRYPPATSFARGLDLPRGVHLGSYSLGLSRDAWERKMGRTPEDAISIGSSDEDEEGD